MSHLDIQLASAQRTLLQLARAALELAVRDGTPLAVPGDLEPELLMAKGCFVTLTKARKLRGCIGNIFPDKPLAIAVCLNARRAGLNDPRFAPVTSDELATICVEVSVLSYPKPLEYNSPAELLDKLRPHLDGVVLKLGPHRATFLPQVWEQLAQPIDFLGQLATKAGHHPGDWRAADAQVFTYEVDAFSESGRGPSAA